MIANKYKATCILGIVSCGFLASYPFANTFWGGLLTRGFGAAMIGGLADWFAVTALFHRPLGIPFRTAIVPRNREKIIQALVYMVESEILMKENIKKRLEEYDLSAILLYAMNENTKQDMRKMIYRFLQDFFLQVKLEELELMIESFVQNNMENLKILPYVPPVVEWFMENGYDDKILDLIINQCIIAAENEKFPHLLADVFVAVRKKYEHGMSRRKIFNQLMDLSPKQLALAAQQGLLSILSEMRDCHHPIRLEGKARAKEFIIKLQNDASLQQTIESWIRQNIVYKFRLQEKIVEFILVEYGKVISDNRILVRGMESLATQFEMLVADFAENKEDRTKLDHYLKVILSQWIDSHHDEIGRIIKDSLNKFTNDRLVRFIEDKMGNDLQMIRINGSVVGGFVGIIIYVLTFWI
jgi:uncharacterized membrane-anchored protein YjiN (DUF445 family)